MIHDEISSATDLTEAVKEALSRRGVLGKVKANLRAEVFHALEDKTVAMPTKPREVFIASELIRDFLSTLHLDNTNSVFCEENGQPPEMSVDRAFLSNELGFNLTASEQRESASIPVLVLLIQQLIKIKEQHDIDVVSSLQAAGSSV